MNRVVVFACGRSGLSDKHLPDLIQLVELPCVGRVSIPLILTSLARGADGVLVLGRHQSTCRFNGGEDVAEQRTDRASRLARMVGLGDGRVQFAEPEAGPGGPLDAVIEFLISLQELGTLPLQEIAPADILHDESLDTSLAIIHWLSEQPGLAPDGATWLDEHELPRHAPHRPLLLAGDLPYLDLLADDLLRPLRPADALRAGIDVLDALGASGAGLLIGPKKTSTPAMTINDLLAQYGAALPRPADKMKIACAGPDQTKLLEALGYEPVDVGPDPLPDSFSISPQARLRAEQRLARAEKKGAWALLVDGPCTLARWALLTREGTWRSSRLRPLLAVHLAQKSLQEVAP